MADTKIQTASEALARFLNPNIFNHPEWWPKRAIHEIQAQHIKKAESIIKCLEEKP